jgi:hypothetical protein
LLDGALGVRGIAFSGSDNETLYLPNVASGWYYICIGYCTTSYADSSDHARYAVTLETGIGFGLGYLSGRVVDGLGQGIPQVFLTLYHSPADWNVSFPSMTAGPGGNFTVAFLPGTYDVNITGKGDGRDICLNQAPINVVAEYYNDKKSLSLADHVSLAAGQTLNLGNIALDTGAIVSGRVTDGGGNPLANTWVYSYDAQGYTANNSALTNANGDYSLNGVPVGGAKIRFSLSGYAAEYYNDRPSFGLGDLLATQSGVTIPGINAQLSNGGMISGTVKDGLGSGLSVNVRLYSVLDETYSRASLTSSTGSGIFNFYNVMPGDYKIYFNSAAAGFAPEWYADAASFAQATVITVIEGNATTGINAVLSPAIIPATITVTAPNGGESWTVGSSHDITWTSTGTIANVKVEYSTDNGTAWTSVTASTPNNGSYAWTVPYASSTQCLVRVSESSTGTLAWNAASNQNWLTAAPDAWTGTGTMNVSVNPSGLAKGTHTGAINVTAAGADNSPQVISVTLEIYLASASTEPFGAFDTPISGSTFRGSISVTGWALDDIEVTKVEVRRGPVTGDPAGVIGADGLVWIGDATFVEGARPDVETAWPGIPLNYRAGWGYMLLTYGLPAQGNGTFVLHAVASDKDGHTTELGTKTIVSDNAHNTKPFGAIDTPAQGGTTSGNPYVNFGWVLTPPPAMVPIDGSTIWLWIDSVQVGHPTYNQFRVDVHDAYPDYLNADGAVGFYYIDTTAYANGMHTIGWSATDDHGQTEGMGSRFFWVFNGSSGAGAAALDTRNGSLVDLAGIPADVLSPIYLRTGFRDSGSHEIVSPDERGLRSVVIEEVGRLVIALDSPEKLPSEGREEREKRSSNRDSVELTGAVRWSGYLVVGNELRPLPIGSTLDSRHGLFFWQPGPGFIGEYRFVFVDGRDGKKKFVTLNIRPKSFPQR